MFTQLHYDHLALLCWAILITTVVGSVFSLAVLFFYNFFKGKATRYALFLGCQLSFIPLLVLTLIFAKPFASSSRQFFEKTADASVMDLPREAQVVESETEALTTVQISQSPTVLGDDSQAQLGSASSQDLERPSEAKVEERRNWLAPLRLTLRNKVQDYSSVFATCWFIGVFFLSLRLIIAAFGLRSLRRSSISACPELARLFSSIKEAVYHKRVELLESVKVASPMVVSWFKPTILIPEGIMSKLPIDQVEALLLHELHHIRRHDFLWNVLQRVSEILFFFNPLIWILGKEVRQLREELCDQSVILQTEAPESYSRALVSLAESSNHKLALAAKPNGAGSLARRLRAILSPSSLMRPISKMNSVVELGLVFLVGLCCFLPVVADLNEDLQSDSLPSSVEHDAPSGRILDPEGNPIAGARVILHYDLPELDEGTDTVVEETVSNAEGYYQFSSKLKFSRMRTRDWEDAYAVFTTHKDWAAGWYFIRPPKIFGDISNPNPAEIDLYLEKPVTQDFTVKLTGKKDENGNEMEATPLEGAKVYLYALYSHRKKPSFHPEGYDPGGFKILGGDLGLSAAFTDENGKCTLTNLPPGKCGFLIVHPKTSRAWKTRTHTNKKDWVTKCFPKTGVSGVLVDEHGQPIADTMIHATTPESWPGWYAKTDKEGRYSFPQLYGKGHNAYRGGGGEAEFSFKIHESDWMLTRRYEVKLTPEKDVTGLKLTASKGIPFHVTVMTKAGEPYPYAPVSVYGINSNRKFTDSKGRATLKVLKGDIHATVAPAFGSSWIGRSPYDYATYNSVNSFLSAEPSSAEVKTVITVDPKPMKTVNGTLTFNDQSQLFNGSIIFYAILPDGMQLESYETIGKRYKTRVFGGGAFSIKVPSGYSYVAVARTNDHKWVGSTVIHSDTVNPVINLETTEPQKVVLYNGEQQPLKNQKITWGEYHQGFEVERIEAKTNKSGEVTLPGLRPDQLYYINGKISERYEGKKIKADVGKVIELAFGQKKAVAVVDQNGQPIPVSDILKFSYIYADGAEKYQRSVRSASINPKSGQLEIPEREYDDLIEMNDVKIDGLFKTAAGSVIEGIAISEHPLTFRAASDITHSLTRPRITPLEKSDLDSKDTFRALIVNQDGEPIEGAKTHYYMYLSYHLHDEYTSIDEFKKKRREKEEQLAQRGGSSNTSTKADGVVYIDDTTRNRSYMVIEAEGYASRWLTKAEISKSPIKIEMIKNTSCQGQLLNERGEPLAFHPIVFITSRSYLTGDKYSPLRQLKPIRVLAMTDKNGRFSELLEVGPWRLHAVISDDVVVDHEFTLREGDSLTLKPEFTPAAHLTVKFKDKATKEAVPDLRINLVDYNGPHSRISIYNEPLTTDEYGTVVFKGLIAGSYTVDTGLDYQDIIGVTKAGYTSAYFEGRPIGSRNAGELSNLDVELNSGGNEYILNLEKGTKVSGRVTLHNDLKFKDALRAQIYIDYESSKRQSDYRGIRVQPDGSFSGYLPKVDGKRLRVFAYHGSGSPSKVLAPAFSEYFTAMPNEDYTFNFHMTPGGSVTGEMTDLNGKPVFGASIRYKHLGGKSESKGVAWAKTDRDGKFIMHGIPTGEIKLTARKGNESILLERDQPESITIAEGETTDIGVIKVKVE